MKSLFDSNTYQEITTRINKLSPETQRQWGKMDVAQMLAHCKEAFKVPLSDKLIPRAFVSYLFGWAIKPVLYNDKPYKESLPTSPNFLIKEQRNFEIEKQQLNQLIDKFHKGGLENVGNFPHPFFGTLTKEQWGKGMYKHLDHHLRQFGA